MEPEEIVVLILEHLGATVTRIPREPGKTPDFYAEIGGTRYLIELKSKGEDPIREAARNVTLGRGDIAEDHDTAERKNVISGLVADAVKQLRAFEARPVDFRLVWLLGWGRLRRLYFDQFEAALYGTTTIADFGPGADEYARPCYYFGLNDFHRHREVLDGAVIWCDNEGKLLLNDLSDRYAALRESALARAMAGGCIDPRDKERNREAYYIDGDVDRRDEGAVLAYLREKYGRNKLINITMQYHGAAVLVPRE
ncbi:hypothetical protein [Thioalkalivibrio sp. XN8]|uniref:hypothetical protein n=1 Tax=Thioalkalivibrio sp. XN8 TaxID=2712863 RepID=UPI0013EB8DC7|nr:hypothetical protein [Thioalkalivibrio sp. XN8]NGP53250.1 hypothetical protein [Thioalkalivibrio sp. XN8]